MNQALSWRERFAPRIQRILDHYAHQHDACTRALRRYYPLTPPWRGGPAHPYRIWRDEIARQQGIKPRVASRRHAPRCVYTLDLFAPRERCGLTLDLFD
jgi:hypothetical protein